MTEGGNEMFTKDNYSRNILSGVYGYSDEQLDSMTDEQCEYEHDFVVNGR